MMIGDLIRAFCISVLSVPVSALASVQEPMQPLATSHDDFVDASIAISAGTSAEQAVLEQQDPIRLSMKFQAQLFETLFDQPYSSQDAQYFLQPGDVSDLDAPVPFNVAGVNGVGDGFLFAVDLIRESDLNQLPAGDQANLAAADIERVWAVAGQLSTSHGAAEVSGAILYGSYQGQDYWQLMPALDPTGEIVHIAMTTQSSISSPGNTQTSVEPMPYNECAQGCQDDFDVCKQIADNNLAGCLIGATAAYAAALAGCAVLSAVSWWTGVGVGAATLCVIAASSAWAGAVGVCYAVHGSAMLNCRTLRDACLAGCCTNDPDGCPQ